MPSITSTLLQLVDMANGENENTWGDTLDANATKLENAIAAASSISSTGGATTLTADQARRSTLIFTGVLAADHIVTVQSHNKLWVVRNAHTLGAFALKFKTSGGAEVTIPGGTYGVNLVLCDGTDIYVTSITEAGVDAKITAASKVYIATVSGTANALVLDTSPAGYTRTAGNIISCLIASDNTAATTVNPEGLGVVNILKQTPAGTAALSGGELQAGNRVLLLDDGTDFQLIGDPTRLLGTVTDIASAATTDLGTILSHTARITGTTGIASFGNSANIAAPYYFVRFAGALTMTHSATLDIAGSVNFTTAADDMAILEFLGSSTWKVWPIKGDGTPTVIPTIPMQTKISGGDVLLQRIVKEVTSVVTLNSPIPIDNTIPQQGSEGVEVLSQAITPKSASSYLIIKIDGFISWNAGAAVNGGAFAVFQDAIADAIYAAGYAPGTTVEAKVSAEFKITNASTTARTYKVRAGPATAGSHYWLGDGSGSAVFGGVAKGSLIIEEWLAV